MNLNCPWQSKIIVGLVFMSLPQALLEENKKEAKKNRSLILVSSVFDSVRFEADGVGVSSVMSPTFSIT